MKDKVALIGDLILDRFIYYKSTKLSPEGPAPIVKRIETSETAGGAGNVAISLANLGLNLSFYFPYSKKNSKIFEKSLLKIFENVQLKLNKIETNIQGINPVKIRYYVDDRQYMREDNEGINLNKISVIKKELIDEIVHSNDVVVVADYQKGCFDSETLSYLISKCNNLSKPLFIDTKNKNKLSINNAFCLKINKTEFNFLYPNFEIIEDDSIQLIKNKVNQSKLLSKINNLIVTLGSKGCIAATDKEIIYSPAVISDVIDITGAGDAFISALVYFFIKKAFEANKEHIETNIDINNIDFANSGASSVVSKKGTLPLDKFFKLTYKGTKHKKEIVGFTNGCFDILHTGHISLFEEAKKHCDFLIVGLNSDSSIKKLKGKNRPLNNQSSRLSMLRSLKHVDEIIIFNEDTPENLLKKIRPDVLIKGADYEIEEIIGANFVKSYGGKVIRANLIKNKSTTKLIEKIKNLK